MEEQSPAAGAPTGSGGRPPAEGRFRSAATTAATAQKPSSRRAVPSGEGDAGRGAEGERRPLQRSFSQRRHPVRVAVVSVVIVVVLPVAVRRRADRVAPLVLRGRCGRFRAWYLPARLRPSPSPRIASS
ncbi:MAG: hypothetical protein ACLUE1_02175 [Adlercreutzia equolifaciens]